jgi:hypothetical protein
MAAGEKDEEDSGISDENRWFDESSKVIFRNIHGANFDPNAYEGAIDLVIAGWFVLYIDEAQTGGYHFEQWPIAECYVSSSRPGEPVDTVYRKTRFTVEQIVNKYGLESCSETVKALYNSGKVDELIAICHAIYPRTLSVANPRMAKNLPFASVHYEIASGKELKESGYHEFPCVVPRWMLIPGTPYATGPASKAIGSVRSLHDVKTLELQNLDLAVGGLWLGVDDGVLNPRTVKLGARKILTAASTDSMKELRSSSDFQVAFMSEERLQSQIRKTLLADQLQPQDGPAMTATEVHARIQLIRQLLGPIYARLQAEYLQPLIARCFGLAYRAGILGTAPESLQGGNFVVKYVSPLARAQRMEEVTAMDRLETALMAEAQADPTVFDVYDFERAARMRGDSLGVPKVLLRSPGDVEKLRRQREEQARAAQQAAAQQEMMTKAAPEVVKRAVA